jgi:hypothetical protein
MRIVSARGQFPMDQALSALVMDCLEPLDPSGFSVTTEWSDRAGMWFTEVEPSDPDCAPISVAWAGGDTVNVAIGNTSFEMFGLRTPSDLAEVRDIVQASLAGRIREAASDRAWGSRAVFDTNSGPVRAGNLASWSGGHTYAPYRVRA